MAKEKDRHKNPRYKADYDSANYDKILLRYRPEDRYKERIKVLADDEGITVVAWIRRAIDRELARESGLREE